MSQAARQRQLRLEQHLQTVLSDAKSLIGPVKGSAPIKSADAQRICDKLAVCCRSLGLTATPGPHEFAHAARLTRCLLAIVAPLPLTAAAAAAAGGGGAAPQQPSSHHMILVEALLQSRALVELSHGLQRLLPEHNASTGDECSCCSPEASAWARPVPFEPTSSNSAQHNQQPARVSVAVASDALLRQQLELVVHLSTWLECAGAALDSGADNAARKAQLLRLQQAAIQQLAPVPAAASRKATRVLFSPPELLFHYCADTLLSGSGWFPARPPSMLHANSVLRPPGGHAQAEKRLRAVVSAQLSVLLRASGGGDGPSPDPSTICRAISRETCLFPTTASRALFTISAAAPSSSSHNAQQQAVTVMHDGSCFAARCMRGALWWWRAWVQPCASGSQDSADHAEAMAGMALCVLASSAVLEAQQLFPLSTAKIAACDCLAALAADKAGAAALGKAFSDSTMSMCMSQLSQVGSACGRVGEEEAVHLLQLGAGRQQAPRCVVSAALARMVAVLEAPAHGSSISPDVTAAEMVRMRATLLCVLDPLATELAAAQEGSVGSVGPDGQGSNASAAASAAGAAAGRVLSAVASPVDVAAALTASFKALHACMFIPVHRDQADGGLARMMAGSWVRLLSSCCTIMAGLHDWLVPAAGTDRGGGSGSSTINTTSSITSSSGSSSSTSWGRPQELWRAALQEYGTCEAAMQVVRLLSMVLVDSPSCAVANLCLVALQPAHVAALSATLVRRLKDQLADCHLTGPAHGVMQLKQKNVAAGNVNTMDVAISYAGHFMMYGMFRLCEMQEQEAQSQLRDVMGSGGPLPQRITAWVACSENHHHDADSSPGAGMAEVWHRLNLVMLLRMAIDGQFAAAIHSVCLGMGNGPDDRPMCWRLFTGLLTVAELLPVRLAHWLAVVTGNWHTGQPGQTVSPWMVEALTSALQAAGAEDIGSVNRVSMLLQRKKVLFEPQRMFQEAVSQILKGPQDKFADVVRSPAVSELLAWSHAACERLMRELRAALAAVGGLAGESQVAGEGPSGAGSGDLMGPVDVVGAFAALRAAAGITTVKDEE